MDLQPSAILVFMAGVLTAFSPCIIPILPPMLAGSVGHRLRPILIVLGSSITFTLMGGFFSIIGTIASKDVLRNIFIIIIIAFGAAMADNDINDIWMRFSSKLINKYHALFNKQYSFSEKRHPLLSAFVLGLSLGIVWIPCVGLILGSVLAYVSYHANFTIGLLLLAIYSLGLGSPMLAIAYGGKYTAGKIKWIQNNSDLMRKTAGFILVIVGLAMLFGLDRYAQRVLLPYFIDLESKLLELYF